MTIGGTPHELRGRRAECARLDRLVAGVRSGQGEVLVVRGEAGIGKSALLDHLVRQADGCRVARASGVESEMELPYAGLHQLCAPMLDLSERLPAPQREALAVAFGTAAGGPPDRFLVGAATLSLLAEQSDRKPLLCVMDDAQWLDQASAQALTFVGRRLLAERVGMVFGLRDPVTGPDWRGIPELTVGRLADEHAAALLDAVIPGRLDEHVRDRIVAETRGNPLAVLELPRGLTAAELAGGFGRPDARSLTSQIEQNFVRRAQALPSQTQRLLLTAAAEPAGDVQLLLRALAVLDVPVDAASPAEEAELIELGARVRFRHPLVRSATYRAATSADRRDVHRALAEATDPGADPDRRAWHRAHGAAGPDEDVAAELVSSAARAQRRGGIAATAAFLRRATELTPDPGTRASRALAAAQATLHAGAFETALRLLVTAGEGPVDAGRHARVDLLRAHIAFASGHSVDAPPLLLDAARRLEPHDVDLSRDTYLDAIAAATFAGRLATGTGLPEAALAARSAPQPQVRRKRDLLLDSVSTLFTDGYPAAVPLIKQAVQAFAEPDGTLEQDDQRWLWLAAVVAVHVWDDESWDVLTARHVRIARELGDLTELPLVLNSRLVLNLWSGQFQAATSLLTEIRTIQETTGIGLAPYGAIIQAAWRGTDDAAALIAASMDDALTRREGSGVLVSHWARALLMNGRARYQEALPSAQGATEFPEFGVANWALSELFESAVRSGRPELAAETLSRLTEMTEASGTEWALGVLARAKALLATGPAAEAGYREAIERLGRTRVRMELARAHLVYGEWLRREGRRQDAREQLRTAYEMFRTAGADAFADRSRHELAATGEAVDERARRTGDALTPQEAHIAELAGSGLTNAEIGARMFLSQHTVEWHLRKVFTKLGITSRRQLRPAGDTSPGLAG